MKLERLIGILMILLHESHVTAKALAQRYCVSIRTIQMDIDILSVAGIPIVSVKGPSGGYSLLDTYKLDKTFLKKDEMKLLTDLLNGLEKLLSQAGFAGIREKMNAINEKDAYFKGEMFRFDFMPWLPQQSIQDRLVELTAAIADHKLVEISYRDQTGNITHRRIEPYQLVMKDYAWYVYGYCQSRNAFRYFKVLRIEQASTIGEVFEPRPVIIEDPFDGLKDKLIDIKLKFTMKAVGKLEDFFPGEDIQYLENHILVKTRYPDDPWLYRILLSFGKEVEVIEPAHLRKRLQSEAKEVLGIYEGEK